MKTIKKFLILTAALTCSFAVNSEAQYKVSPKKYAVKFTDKDNNAYTLEKPSEFLSQKALDRREKFSIGLDSRDLPVTEKYVDSLKSLGFGIQGVSK